MQTEILKKITDIFREDMFRDLTKCNALLSENIFGERIALLPAEAYFLLVRLEEEFQIRFPKEVITEYRFQTVGSIISEIEKEILKKDVKCCV